MVRVPSGGNGALIFDIQGARELPDGLYSTPLRAVGEPGEEPAPLRAGDAAPSLEPVPPDRRDDSRSLARQLGVPLAGVTVPSPRGGIEGDPVVFQHARSNRLAVRVFDRDGSGDHWIELHHLRLTGRRTFVGRRLLGVLATPFTVLADLLSQPFLLPRGLYIALLAAGRLDGGPALPPRCDG